MPDTYLNFSLGYLAFWVLNFVLISYLILQNRKLAKRIRQLEEK